MESRAGLKRTAAVAQRNAIAVRTGAVNRPAA
jgi:hypothetical protein